MKLCVVYEECGLNLYKCFDDKAKAEKFAKEVNGNLALLGEMNITNKAVMNDKENLYYPEDVESLS